jgi:hypothetical protein
MSKVPALRSIYDRFAHVMNADKREKLIKAAMRKSKLEFGALNELFEFKEKRSTGQKIHQGIKDTSKVAAGTMGGYVAGGIGSLFAGELPGVPNSHFAPFRNRKRVPAGLRHMPVMGMAGLAGAGLGGTLAYRRLSRKKHQKKASEKSIIINKLTTNN